MVAVVINDCIPAFKPFTIRRQLKCSCKIAANWSLLDSTEKGCNGVTGPVAAGREVTNFEGRGRGHHALAI
jgi:hypothetical protein